MKKINPELPQASTPATPKPATLQYKLFWNWDHSTTWCLNTLGTQNCGVGNYYTKAPDVFLKDFTRVIDFAAAQKIDAIGIVGLMRDAHGGDESARRLCGYAREHGVRIYLIAGLYSYGGLYYEGDSPLSLKHFLAANPDCIGRNIGGTPAQVPRSPQHNKTDTCGCPSNPKLRNYVLDTLSMLFSMVPELGGIQMEVGDSWLGLCMCEACRARRDAMQGDPTRTAAYYFSDMANIYPEAAGVIHNRNKDAWVICEMYGHFLNNPVYGHPENPAMQAMLKMPENTFLQWGDRQLNWDIWAKAPAMPKPLRKFRHIMRCHHGTQWSGGRATIAVEEIRRQCRLSLEAGMQAVSLFGESSPFHTNAEFNYLAMQYFADHPNHSTNDFAANVLAPKLGGSAELGKRYLEFAVLNRTPEKIPVAELQIAKIIGKLKAPEALRRWCYLASFLNSFYYERRELNAQPRGGKINLDII